MRRKAIRNHNTTTVFDSRDIDVAEVIVDTIQGAAPTVGERSRLLHGFLCGTPPELLTAGHVNET
jgi:hypothetical protein